MIWIALQRNCWIGSCANVGTPIYIPFHSTQRRWWHSEHLEDAQALPYDESRSSLLVTLHAESKSAE